MKQLCHITRYARRIQRTLIRSSLLEGGGGLYHFIAGGGVVLKEIFEQLKILLSDQKVLMFLTEKVFMNGNQGVLNRFSTSGLTPSRPGS